MERAAPLHGRPDTPVAKEGHPRHLLAETERDAAPAEGFREDLDNLAVGEREEERRLLDDGHGDPERRQGGGDLEPDHASVWAKKVAKVTMPKRFAPAAKRSGYSVMPAIVMYPP